MPTVCARRRSIPGKGAVPACMMLGVALTCAFIGERSRIVAFAPQFGALFAAAGMPAAPGAVLKDVTSTIVDGGDGAVMAVAGDIVNTGPSAAKLASLRLSLAGKDGREIYHWTTPAPKVALDPGESISFRVKLDSPPADAQQVSVRFSKPGDDAWLGR